MGSRDYSVVIVAMAVAVILHLLCFFLLLLPFSSKAAQAYKNVSLGDSLSSSDKNPKWVSPSGDFAFGFKPINNDLFLLGIWFNKIPEQTLVWVANRENNPTVEMGSKVELTQDGRLVLIDPRGQQLWQANSSDGSVVSAAMLDTGNFVLSSSTMDLRWQSFDEPTDTILPRQNLDRGQTLSSNLAETDYSLGRFALQMQSDGNLVLSPVSPFARSNTNYLAYWNSTTADSGVSLVLNSSGYMYIELRNGSLFYLTQPNDVPASASSGFYHRVTLDYDGVFRQYIYQKSEQMDGSWAQSTSWSIVWRALDDACQVGGYQRTFPGPCGFNGYCISDNNKAKCLCPPGYSYLNENYTFKGCKPDFVVQDCQEQQQQQDESRFEFKELIGINWPSSDFEFNDPVDEAQCRKICMQDCFCAAAIFFDYRACWKKKFPLTNGREYYGTKALFKVALPRAPPSPVPPQLQGRKSDNRHLVLVRSVLLSSSVFFIFILLLAISLLVIIPRNRRQQKTDRDSRKIETNLRVFSYKELEEATDVFKEELGRGAFGIVYKGVLATTNSQTPIAVKKLDKMVQEGEKEFKTELSAIGKTHHKNLVKLLGFCDEGTHRLLVYEFMSNGSLASFLFRNPRPNWNQRLQIASGIARGLMYLHEECSTQIIHCDIKPQNILLDASFIPKISDFGLAKLLMNEQSRTSTAIRGTKGYVAPEWFRNLPITVHVDVYSFGILLLEIICCRKNVEQDLDEQRAILTDWAYDCFNQGRLDLLVENDEEAILDNLKALERMVMIAFWCTHEQPSFRPSMKKVTQMLEGAIEVARPPDPSSFICSLD